MKKLWMIFIAIFVFSFAILGWVGAEIFRQAPPIPREVVTTDGQVLIAAEDISNGQNVWQAMGGMESGSIWGLGHQGYEYVDLGRIWQGALFVGLLLWLFLIARTAIPALKQKGTAKSLITLYFLSTAGIALFYSPGLFWGMRSHLSVVEYWRWWVVHLWVEGYFRSFCDGCHCVLVRQAARYSRRERRAGGAAFRRDLFKRRNYRHPSSPVFCWNANRGARLRLGV
jgi:nitric oxide reductase large subunit